MSKKIGYIFDHNVGLFNYGCKHPMNPIRVLMTHSLISSLKLDTHMDIYKPTATEIFFHDNDYQRGLGSKTTEDCPYFEGVKEYVLRYSSASINAAQLINEGYNDIVFNWAGGMHHAKKSEASGFCYFNDIVMCILKLLEKHQRVLYIDIDIHHGDGVEEAFYNNDRVLTVSLHKHGDNFFPETGDLIISNNKAINIPLQSGITDEMYHYIYNPIISHAFDKFQPNVIVFQSGADSLIGDKLGQFSLTIEGHSKCLNYIRQFNVPIVILGGGGYTVENVSRTWAYETAVICDAVVPETIPEEDNFYPRYSEDKSLSNINIENSYNDNNTKKYLNNISSFIHDKIENF